jgi:hypothetical protein
MKNTIRITLFIIFTTTLISCKKEKVDDKIVHVEVNKQFILIRDISQLQQAEDPISMHVDSILNGFIETNIVSTGHQKFDLNGDQIYDIAFEIIDLMVLNNGTLPAHFDSLAARAVPYSVEILDNSTYGYADALTDEFVINKDQVWQKTNCVLGTFANAGQFQGAGDRFLGIRIQKEDDFQYGWIKLNCSQHNDTLKIISYAYNTNIGSQIKAGQTE